ncbi:ras association domain-containing protein 8-like [Asterias rubens]|uniref:ras association domain-containing protein 8-like n=1 Tax=Asterias rubens TaxID=7604 RepID=UPI0014552406|nr:ras association domain-containing protein 8-like [Asterias rubens]XP_033645467.1 ras association domain-containing protein 8-like [Asterias rubens]
MVELKVVVDGVQRIVCGVSDHTRCQDVIIALAQATGQIGRFNLIEKCHDSERSLKPHENPLRLMSKWGPNSKDFYFLMRKTGTTPGNSRPPSVTQEINDRFKQVISPTESFEDFHQQRQASVRRSQTFSGYRGGTSEQRISQKHVTNPQNQNKHQELSELVSIQKARLAQQQQDLCHIETLIQTLEEFSQTPNDSDPEIEEFELRSRQNKAELQELEFWESEVEIERQLHSALSKEIAKFKGRMENCVKELSLQQHEIVVLSHQMEEYRNKQRQVEEDAAKIRLEQMKDEAKLLQQEYEEYTKTTKEMDLTLAELNCTLEDRRSLESRLKQDLACDNLKDFSKTSSKHPQDEDKSEETQGGTLSRLPRQRAESSPQQMYATFPFRRLVSARHLVVAASSSDDPEGVFV